MIACCLDRRLAARVDPSDAVKLRHLRAQERLRTLLGEEHKGEMP
jgi:hypothetical protein